MHAATPGVVTLTLDHPEKGNALSAPLVERLSEGIQGAIADPSVHTLVIQGAGRHFCTGFDLSDLEQETEGDLLYRFIQIERLLSTLWHAPIRTVAIGQGHVLGAGADLFTACDIRLARPDTAFRFPGASFGLVLGTRRLAERVGADRALAWTSSGASIKQEEAIACGLASQSGDVAAAQPPAPYRTDRETFSALRAATRADRRDQDLAALVASIMNSSLKARLLAHRDRARAAAAQRKKAASP
ncbi:MAG: enoyl-CoA hydratase/isomerase family protein [Castellaniella sp.]|uniref:enoyl-CoA hydratase/isomerase family protein n=1 Tax=Castellaniella sp. TaxID=1955812 RepID=UPI003C72A0DE